MHFFRKLPLTKSHSAIVATSASPMYHSHAEKSLSFKNTTFFAKSATSPVFAHFPNINDIAAHCTLSFRTFIFNPTPRWLHFKFKDVIHDDKQFVCCTCHKERISLFMKIVIIMINIKILYKFSIKI